MAEVQFPNCAAAQAGAMLGLQRSLGYYDVRQGYSFREYAKHWVIEHVDRAMNKET
ncbi:MAG TPA: hypothetical protein VL282_00095 [Tepidisphaeraceae bacterium]|nr:hypothetical protein [Tepidisphaeraceae bacterium]